MFLARYLFQDDFRRPSTHHAHAPTDGIEAAGAGVVGGLATAEMGPGDGRAGEDEFDGVGAPVDWAKAGGVFPGGGVGVRQDKKGDDVLRGVNGLFVGWVEGGPEVFASGGDAPFLDQEIAGVHAVGIRAGDEDEGTGGAAEGPGEDTAQPEVLGEIAGKGAPPEQLGAFGRDGGRKRRVGKHGKEMLPVGGTKGTAMALGMAFAQGKRILNKQGTGWPAEEERTEPRFVPRAAGAESIRRADGLGFEDVGG